MDKVLLRPVEVALLLGISRSLVYLMLASGELPSITIHKTRRIPAAALDAYIEQRLVAQAQQREEWYAPGEPLVSRGQASTHRVRGGRR